LWGFWGEVPAPQCQTAAAILTHKSNEPTAHSMATHTHTHRGIEKKKRLFAFRCEIEI